MATELKAVSFYGSEVPRPYLIPTFIGGGKTKVKSYANPHARESRPTSPLSILVEWGQQASWKQGGFLKTKTSGSTTTTFTIKNGGKPKRAPNAYFLFAAKERTQLSGSVAEVAKEVGKRWKALPADRREVFEAEAAELQKEYKESMSQWRERIGTLSKTERNTLVALKKIKKSKSKKSEKKIKSKKSK